MTRSGEIYPPCGVKLGDKEPDFICNAIILEGDVPGHLKIDNIITWLCDAFTEEGTCPQGYSRINGKITDSR